MRRVYLIAVLGVAACGAEGDASEDLPPFDPSVVVYADGCTPVPEAQACIDAHPAEFLPGNSAQVAAACLGFGYTCCVPEDWISAEAARCIAEQDARFSVFAQTTVTATCNDQVFGPMFGVYGEGFDGYDIGVGVHAATGRVTFFDDGSGVFS